MLADEVFEIIDETEVEAKYQGDDVKLDLSAKAVERLPRASRKCRFYWDALNLKIEFPKKSF